MTINLTESEINLLILALISLRSGLRSKAKLFRDQNLTEQSIQADRTADETERLSTSLIHQKNGR